MIVSRTTPRPPSRTEGLGPGKGIGEGIEGEARKGKEEEIGEGGKKGKDGKGGEGKEEGLTVMKNSYLRRCLTTVVCKLKVKSLFKAVHVCLVRNKVIDLTLSFSKTVK